MFRRTLFAAAIALATLGACADVTLLNLSLIHI